MTRVCQSRVFTVCTERVWNAATTPTMIFFAFTSIRLQSVKERRKKKRTQAGITTRHGDRMSFFLYYNTKYPVKGKRYEKYKTSIENDYLDSMTV